MLSLLADGQWHSLEELTKPLALVGDARQRLAIAAKCVDLFRRDGLIIEERDQRLRLVDHPRG
jgi:biotin operon repressor